jgi:hypothetical protein
LTLRSHSAISERRSSRNQFVQLVDAVRNPPASVSGNLAASAAVIARL